MAAITKSFLERRDRGGLSLLISARRRHAVNPIGTVDGCHRQNPNIVVTPSSDAPAVPSSHMTD